MHRRSKSSFCAAAAFADSSHEEIKPLRAFSNACGTAERCSAPLLLLLRG
jgi:hypothetical protein